MGGRRRLTTTRRGALALLLVGVPSTAWAVSTAAFDLEGTKAFEAGRFEGTSLRSDGRVVRAPHAEIVELEGASVAYSSAVDSRGRVFVGTGNEGRILKVEGERATEHAKLDAAVVTSLAAAGESLFAGAMPSSDVFRIDASGAVKVFASLQGVEHVWALAHDAKRNRLYVGTGPEGRLYAVDAGGKPTLLLDVDAEHILAVALGEDGAVYAGTSDGALLYRVDGKRTEVVYDFPGDELGALSVRGGDLAVASNSFPELPKAPKKAPNKPPKLKPGKAEVWRVHPGGRAESLLSIDDSHVSAVELAEDGSVLAAATELGRVLRIDGDGEYGVWAEVEGRKLTALGVGSPQPHLLASDGAALVRLVDEGKRGTWTSEALDAETVARWGELSPRASGKVEWQTRSGNTEEPGATWSPWSRPSRGAGPVRSPAARYLQVRALLSGDAELRSIEALYLASNRPARSRNVHVAATKKPDEDDFVDGVLRMPSELTLAWDVDNPDDDALLFTLEFALDGSDRYLPLTKPDAPAREPKVKWQTEHVPDGLYRVRVTTSDALDNPAAYALESSVESGLIRVDNHAPRLRLTRDGGSLKGEAEDDTSRIAALTRSVDGGPFLPVAPADDLLDQRLERFVIDLAPLGAGTHIVAVRATDAAGNARIMQQTVDVR